MAGVGVLDKLTRKHIEVGLGSSGGCGNVIHMCPHAALGEAIGEENLTGPVVDVDAASVVAAVVAQCVAQYDVQPRAHRVSQRTGRCPALIQVEVGHCEKCVSHRTGRCYG